MDKLLTVLTTVFSGRYGIKALPKVLARSVMKYLSNRPQVSMGYRLINHAGCW